MLMTQVRKTENSKVTTKSKTCASSHRATLLPSPQGRTKRSIAAEGVRSSHSGTVREFDRCRKGKGRLFSSQFQTM